MTIELNEVLLSGDDEPLSLVAGEGCLTCITGGSRERRSRWLLALMGFERAAAGYVSVDGEPLSGGCIAHLRQQLAYVPESLATVGTLVPYEPPTMADVLALRANRRLGISEADIEAECRRTGTDGQKAMLLALAVLRRKAVLVVDSPEPASASYLLRTATEGGRTVIVATGDDGIAGMAHSVARLA